jgi:hypothetical protein
MATLAEEPLAAYAADDPVAENNQRREAARVSREDADVMRYIMATKPGRAWLFRFLAKCNIMGDSFVPGQADSTAFRLGQENIGKQVWLSAQSASIDDYLTMIKEQQAEEKRLEGVRQREEQSRRNEDEGTSDSPFMPDLPPPAGYPGGPDLPKDKNKGKAK